MNKSRKELLTRFVNRTRPKKRKPGAPFNGPRDYSHLPPRNAKPFGDIERGA